MNKTNKFITWGNFTYNLENEIINKDLLKNAIDAFFKKKLENKYKKDVFIGFIARLGTEEGVIKSLNKFTRVNTSKEDQKFMLDYLFNLIEFKEEGYSDLVINRIIFTYAIFEGKTQVNYNETKPNLFKRIPMANYSHYKIPVVVPNGIDQLYNYGKIISNTEIENTKDKINMVFYIQGVNNIIFVVHHYGFPGKNLYNKVNVIKNGDNVLEFLDRINLEQDKWFRTFNNREYEYNLNGELLFLTQNKHITKKINSTHLAGFMDTADQNFVTLDFETFNSVPGSSDQLLKPYLLVFHSIKADTKEKVSEVFYLTDYESSDIMILHAIKQLIKFHKHNSLINRDNYNKAYDVYYKDYEEKAKHIKLKDPQANPSPKARRDDWANLICYAHNLGSFDATFLKKYLIDYFAPNIQILENDDNRILSMKVSFVMNIMNNDTGKRSKKTLTITFFDSLNLLPSSLDKLSKSFSNGDKLLEKLTFDHKKVTFANLLAIKNEVIRYCIRDCESLYNIIKQFNQIVYKNWQTVIWNLPTISSLAFNIYRIKYIPEDLIPQISGNMFDFIKQSFFGGSCEAYKPFHNYDEKKELLYSYDCNSIYPAMMKDALLPCGEAIYFEGDLLKERPGKLAICYCEVECPIDLDQPFLPVHVLNKSVTGVGSFDGIYYSKDIEHALTLGYKIKVINGIYFTKAEKLFDKYVEDLYQLRLSFEKEDPMNLISKLLLNSLFGRFALDDRYSTYKAYLPKEFAKLSEKPEFQDRILDIKNYGEGKVLVKLKYDNINNHFNSNYEKHLTSIAIAAAITSEGRIFMSKFKNNPDLELFYTDTDSIFTTASPDKMNILFPGIVSSTGLGKMKLENIIKYAVFLSPKAYWLKLEDGSEIIKIKGVKKEFIEEARANHSLNFENFANLLHRNEIIEIKQDKWFRDYSNANISICKQAYTIKQNQNKRVLIYNDNDFCVATKPIIFDKEKFKEAISKDFF